MQFKIMTILVTVIATVLIGCEKSPPPMPEVNEANCKDGKIMEQIKDKETLQAFAGGCSRLPRFKKTENPEKGLQGYFGR
ncbi:MAG: entry exclusion lipoprotein TrbK [Candidatus Accumulibacter sp.]|jgi:entry exclusion lipoprotein TrbK|nr:entry exclusion lipoprotein TrbK [Accumulibacter sp.]